MKNILLIAIAIFTAGFNSAQNLVSYDSDEIGKIYYRILTESSNSNNNLLNPNELDIDWNTPDFDLSENPTQDSWDSRMAVGNDGTVYAVYNDNYTNGLQKIMFRKKAPGGDWTDPIYVDAGGEIGERNNHFPAIAVAPNGDLHVTYNVWAYENVRNYVGYSYYNAASDTWSDGVKISDLNGTVNHFSSHHDIYCTDDSKPVVVWGYDYRANMTNEEIYMKYFDGENWSADIPVSVENDGFDAGNPNIKSIGNGKAMILYAEKVDASNYELRYRIYDETTHGLSEPFVAAAENVNPGNYTLVSTGSEIMFSLIHKATGPDRDVINIYNYDIENNNFTLSDNLFEAPANAGGLFKQADMDCKPDGDCGVLLTDYMEQTFSFMAYDSASGFGEPEIIAEQNPGFDKPNLRFDPDGNVHCVWSDYRFDDGEGYDEREVIYKMGINNLLDNNEVNFSPVRVYPNPSNGTFTVSADKNYRLEIFDLAGRLMKTENVSGMTNVNLSVPDGTYILRFTNGKDVQVKKLLVK
jgi:hypothetical protein